MKSNRKKLDTLALGAFIAVATPAMLLATAGTAQADTVIVSWSPVVPGAGGLTAIVTDASGKPTHCTYDATAVGLPLPLYHYEFDLEPYEPEKWFIPVIATGTTWKTVVRCTEPGNPANQISYYETTKPF